MLVVHQSNRLEVLADQLVAEMSKPLSDPFAIEQVVVQHPGMGRWLNYRVADALGIAANIDYVLPAGYLWQLYQSVLGLDSIGKPLGREQLSWMLFALLRDLPDEPDLSPLADYLKDASDEVKVWQLAVQLGDCFDRYMLYRPEWIQRWEREESLKGTRNEKMFASLWRLMVDGYQGSHRVHVQQQFESYCQSNSLSSSSLPERLFLFGVDTLPPVHLAHFAAVAEVIPVLLFIHNPSREFWQDIRTRKEQIQELQQTGLSEDEAYLTEGNRLLATMGKSLRDFLQSLDDFVTDEGHAFEDIEAQTLLGAVQADILDLKNPAEESYQHYPLAENDFSIEFRSCHTATRELEVLKDYLLHLFDTYPDLAPRDIIVMTPDINAYAPMIDAVFGQEQAHYIGYTVADRLATQTQPMLQAFINVIGMPAGRFCASEILDLLMVESVSTNFGVDADALELMRSWVDKTGIRWGLDDAFKTDIDLPGTLDNTWKQGFERLLSGYAMSSDFTGEIGGQVPFCDIEGNDTRLLGALMDLLDSLRWWREESRKPATMAGWQLRIMELLNRLFCCNHQEQLSFNQISGEVIKLQELVKDTPAESISFGLGVLRRILEPRLQEPGPRNRFLSGQMTFCNLQPMRSIPFKVVCLIGMNGSDFPRVERPLSFDLMATDKRAGDRSRREDDRYLFLQAFLSARENLYISYQGHSVQDNSEKQPSVMVLELLDYVQLMTGFEKEALVSRLVTQMPLQPFSKSSFSSEIEARLRSHSDEWAQAAQMLNCDRIEKIFYGEALGEIKESEDKRIYLNQLIRFFECPALGFMQHRLTVDYPKIKWEDKLQEMQTDVEPFEIDALGRWGIKSDSLIGYLQEQQLSLGKRLHLLPQGVMGEMTTQTIEADLETFLEGIPEDDRNFFLTTPPAMKEIPLKDGYVLVMNPIRLGHDSYVTIEPGKMYAKNKLRAWFNHLCTQLASGCAGGVEGRIYKEGMDAPLRLKPIEYGEARELLTQLWGIYWQGLLEPVPFFAETSLVYQETLLKKDGDEKAAMAAARKKYYESFGDYHGESSWQVNQLFFKDDPFEDDRFTELAETVYQPFLESICNGEESE